MSKTITLNSKTYVEVDPNKKDIKPAVETDHIIVIAQRGWIFEGYKDNSIKDVLVLLNANVVRSWSNGKGIASGKYNRKSAQGSHSNTELDEILTNLTNFMVWEGQQDWKPDYDRDANRENEQDIAKLALQQWNNRSRHQCESCSKPISGNCEACQKAWES